MSKERVVREPYVWEASVSMLSLVAGIGISIVIYGTDPHIGMLLGVFVSSIIAWRMGYSWDTVEKGMIQGISNSLQAIIILCVIGILIGVWILSGVVPTLVYYGLKVLHPSIFLPAALIICSVTSLATGSSWGTVGTVGIALIGIGKGLGFPLPIVGGAILSGAYFGDKMSPLSDTTNLAPAMAGTDLYTHIRHMLYTTGVSYAITLVLEIVLGFFYGGGAGNDVVVNEILTTLDGMFFINPILLLPPLVVMFFAFKKVPAIPGITAGIIVAAILGFIFQQNNFGDFINAAYAGFSGNTGVEAVDSLLTKGGFSSMMYAVSIVLCSMMFGGIMEKTNQLTTLVNWILSKSNSTAALITAVVVTCLGANIIICDQYMAIVLGARMYAQKFKEKGLHPKNLSRAVEDTATVTSCLVPWNAGGIYMASTLGVATLAYLPFAFFNWISPIVTLLYGWFNITITPLDEDKK